jgi:hypothetical protein
VVPDCTLPKISLHRSLSAWIFFFSRQVFKTLKSERRFQVADGADFEEENSKLCEKFLKVFLHPPPPLERENLLGLFNERYQKGAFCQYLRRNCEKYLFEDHHLKSDKTTWILTSESSGSYQQVFRLFMEATL